LFYCVVSFVGNPFFQAHGAVPLLVDTDHPEVVSVKVTGVENKGISTTGSFYVQVSTAV